MIHVLEAGRTGKTDPEQLVYATAQHRAILTHNIRDFRDLNKQYRDEGRDHFGIDMSVCAEAL